MRVQGQKDGKAVCIDFSYLVKAELPELRLDGGPVTHHDPGQLVRIDQRARYAVYFGQLQCCLLYTSPSPRDLN